MASYYDDHIKVTELPVQRGRFPFFGLFLMFLFSL